VADRIEIHDWSPLWAEAFRARAARLRDSLGPLALRIDHVGSTSIPGMAAKPVIDIQVSVAGFEPMAPIEAAMSAAGYDWRPANHDKARRYFREKPGTERTHVHVRGAGSWHEQWALLFRDYMRATPSEHPAYVALKRDLAARFADNRPAYVEGKADMFWAIIRRANEWASDTGWRVGPPDA
jgi:GrpB-like predicted nucleotidyltransferase (UPF0157 family)